MNPLGKWVFVAGLALALIVGLFIQGNIAPWFVAGLGLLKIAAEVRSFLLAGTALTVALISIQAQPYNPDWLTDEVPRSRAARAFVCSGRLRRR